MYLLHSLPAIRLCLTHLAVKPRRILGWYFIFSSFFRRFSDVVYFFADVFISFYLSVIEVLFGSSFFGSHLLSHAAIHSSIYLFIWSLCAAVRVAILRYYLHLHSLLRAELLKCLCPTKIRFNGHDLLRFLSFLKIADKFSAKTRISPFSSLVHRRKKPPEFGWIFFSRYEVVRFVY